MHRSTLYAVDVDFVRKSVHAIGRCAIKVEQAAERCVSTLLDLAFPLRGHEANFYECQMMPCIRDSFLNFICYVFCMQSVNDLDYWRICRED